MSLFLVVLASVVATLLVGLLVLNLSAGEKKVEQQLEPLYAVDDPQFRRSLSALLGPQVLDGNQITVLRNGDEIFPAMLEAIGQARHTITFETFIYWSGSIGAAFAEALAARARAGVQVHVLLDWVGSAKLDPPALQALHQAGAQVRRYHQPHWWNLARLNNRTHRKVLVVDGTTGFTGGVGIADPWQGQAQDEEHWRDTHFRVRGPVVAQVQAVFTDNWMKSTGRVLHGNAYFPALHREGELCAQMFSSSPTGGSESMHLLYLMAITAAQRSLDLASAYFVPDELAVTALADAARRGVRVRIVTPGRKTDKAVVRRASRERWGPLLEAGVLIAEYQPTMYHCKQLVVDGLLVSVGSTNFDNRSFRLNDEANLNVLDGGLARELTGHFEEDLRHARPMTLEAWRRRPWRDKLVERLASTIGSQL